MNAYECFRFLCFMLCVHILPARHIGMQDNAECRKEHGVCSKHVYEKTRLVALRSSECTSFCQCAHASTEVDGNVTYMWVRQRCPPTTLFDDSLPSPVCNHDYKVHCYGEYDGTGCRSEHGTCTQLVYDNVRLVALKNSGCKHFCQCAHASTELDSSVTFQWIEHSCPRGTLFDNSLRVCNHERQVPCEGFGPHKEEPITNEQRTTPKTTPITTERTKKCEKKTGDEECFREYGVCTKDQYENVRLVALRRSGCKHFCQCAHASTEANGSVTYKWVKKACPRGTLFDESLPTPVCNHNYNVQCPDDESKDCTEEHGICTGYVYEHVRLVPKSSSSCKQFCQCSYASTEMGGLVTFKWVEHNCPPGTLFDQELRVCNFAVKVECKENTYNDDEDCRRQYGSCNDGTSADGSVGTLEGSQCGAFCKCEHETSNLDGTVTYKWAAHRCPPGTLFDKGLKVCNHGYQVTCDEVDENSNSKYDDCREELDIIEGGKDVTDEEGNESGGSDIGNGDNIDKYEKENDENDGSDEKDKDETLASEGEKVAPSIGGTNLGVDGINEKTIDEYKEKFSNEAGGKEQTGSEKENEEGTGSAESDYNNKDTLKIEGSKNKENINTDKGEEENTKESGNKSKKVKSNKSESKTKSNKSESEDKSKSKSKSKSETKTKDKIKSSKSESKDISNKSESKVKSNGSESKVNTNKSKTQSDIKSNNIYSGSKSKKIKSVKSKTAKSNSKDRESQSTDKKSKSKGKSKQSRRGNPLLNMNDVNAESELKDVSNNPFRCFQCQDSDTNARCNAETEICSLEQQSCETIVEWSGDSYSVRKGCKMSVISSKATIGCVESGTIITCSYVCRENMCNRPLPAVILYD